MSAKSSHIALVVDAAVLNLDVASTCGQETSYAGITNEEIKLNVRISSRNSEVKIIWIKDKTLISKIYFMSDICNDLEKINLKRYDIYSSSKSKADFIHKVNIITLKSFCLCYSF